MYTVLLPVETVLELRDQVEINEIDSIRIVLDDFCWFTSKQPEKWDPHTRETADHSIPYLVVAALLDGEISEKTYTPERYRDPQVLALLKKVTLEKDSAYTRQFPKTFNCLIEVTGKSGQKWTQHRKNPKGHPSNPMSDDEINDKFLILVRDMLNPKKAQDILKLLWRLEELEDVGQIFDALQA